MNIIEKIRKLWAHANSAKDIGNQAEAEAFAAKAQEMLMQHKLDMSVLEVTAETPEELVERWDVDADTLFGVQRTAGWRGVLAQGLSSTHFCKIVRTSRWDTSRFRKVESLAVFGAPSDREVFSYLLEQLTRVIEKCAPKGTPRGVANAYRLGFASGVVAKIRAQRAESERNPHAVVLIRKADAAVAERVQQDFPRLGPKRSTSTRYGDAFRAGQAAGSSHNVNHGIRAGATRAVLSLGGGR